MDERVTEVCCKIELIRDYSVAVSDGTTEDHIDRRTGQICVRTKFFWLPKSQIEPIQGGDLVEGKPVVLQLPEWLASDQGLI